jgi:hypothetical protein
VLWLALLGRRADDPETAWLVVQFIRQTPWYRARVWVRGLALAWVVGIGAGIGLVAIGAANAGSLWRFNIALAVCIALVLALTWGTFPRAIRLNEPMSEMPESGET